MKITSLTLELSDATAPRELPTQVFSPLSLATLLRRLSPFLLSFRSCDGSDFVQV